MARPVEGLAGDRRGGVGPTRRISGKRTRLGLSALLRTSRLPQTADTGVHSLPRKPPGKHPADSRDSMRSRRRHEAWDGCWCSRWRWRRRRGGRTRRRTGRRRRGQAAPGPLDLLKEAANKAAAGDATARRSAAKAAGPRGHRGRRSASGSCSRQVAADDAMDAYQGAEGALSGRQGRGAGPARRSPGDAGCRGRGDGGGALAPRCGRAWPNIALAGARRGKQGREAAAWRPREAGAAGLRPAAKGTR